MTNQDLDSRQSKRVLICDDEPRTRQALKTLLLTREVTYNDESSSIIYVVGEARDGYEAVQLVKAFLPQVVVIDACMPGMDGLEATRKIKREFPRTSVLVLTAAQDPSYLSEALKAGAAGYVQKGATTEETIGAVRKVLEGESSLDQELATQLLKRLMEDPEPEPNGVPNKESPSGLLSTREREVLGLVARGYANQQIARKLLISVSTVKKHVRNVICKLGVSDRTQAAVRAVELGVLDRCKEE